MARRSGKVQEIVFGDSFVGCRLAISTPAATTLELCVFYDKTPAPIGQGEILRRSLTIASLQRALEASLWVTVDYDPHPSPNANIKDPRDWGEYARLWVSTAEMAASDESAADLIAKDLLAQVVKTPPKFGQL